MKLLTITTNNYESFFLFYVDNELTELEKQEVEDFVKFNPDLSVEFDLIKQSRLLPEEIIYTQKHLLYKQEEEIINTIPMEQAINVISKNTFILKWYHLAAAAIIGLIFVIINFTNSNHNSNNLKAEVVLSQPKPNSGNQIKVKRTEKLESVVQVVQKNKTLNPIKKVQLYNSEKITDINTIEVTQAEKNLAVPNNVLSIEAVSIDNQRQNTNQASEVLDNKPLIYAETLKPVVVNENTGIIAETNAIKPKKGLNKLKAFINKIDSQLDALTSSEPSLNEHSIKVAAFTIPLKK